MKKKYPACYWLILLLLVLSCEKKDTYNNIPKTQALKTFSALEKNFTYGGAVAGVTVNKGAISTTPLVQEVISFGMSDETTKLSTNMSLGIGSNTKTFTAALVFKLIEDEKLRLTDNLDDLLPERVNNNISGKITVEQLLTHSSGLYDPLNANNDLINSVFADPSHVYTVEEFYAKVLTPSFSPGAQHSYSNSNYMLLGLIIEKVTGKSYHAFLRETIIDPLKLSSTFLSGKEELPSSAVEGYSWNMDGNSLKNFSRSAIESIAWSAGSIFGTVEDMMNWYQALFSGKIISSVSLEKMKTTTPGEFNLNYGAGIFSKDYKGHTVYAHSGQTIAYNSFFLFDETLQSIVVVITNETKNDVEKIAYTILDDLITEYGNR